MIDRNEDLYHQFCLDFLEFMDLQNSFYLSFIEREVYSMVKPFDSTI